MASGVDLGPAGEHHEHQLGGLWAIGGSVVGSLQGGTAAALKTAHHRPPNGPHTPQLMLMMLARRAPRSTHEERFERQTPSKQGMLGTHENLDIYSVFASFQSDKKGASDRDSHAKRGRPSARS